ncbi:hypothetical protein [Peribacillus butanolivorans]|uniref:hypothetical protein n=1 Tax=Peribacillus butanolivorans TaxID=421767 RepID=UPI0036729FA1
MKAKGFSSQKQAKNWLREKGLIPHQAEDITIKLIPKKLLKNYHTLVLHQV